MNTNRILVNFDASRVVCIINSQNVRHDFSLPEPNLQQPIPFNEDNLIHYCREVENEVKLGFLLSLVNTNKPTKKIIFPYNMQDFKDCVNPFNTLLS